MLQNSRHEHRGIIRRILRIHGLHRNIKVHAVARLIPQRLRRKVRMHAGGFRQISNRPLDGRRIVCRGKRCPVMEVDLILSGSLLVMGCLRRDSHVKKGEADVAAKILALVIGTYGHIACLVDRHFRSLSLLVLCKGIELKLRPDVHFKALFLCCPDCLLQQISGILLIRRSVRLVNITEHPADASIHRSPRHNGNRRRIRTKKEIRARLLPEAGNGRTIDGNSLCKCSPQLLRHNGNVLLFSEDIEKCQSNEFHIFLFNEIQYFLIGAHSCNPPSVTDDSKRAPQPPSQDLQTADAHGSAVT